MGSDAFAYIGEQMPVPRQPDTINCGAFAAFNAYRAFHGLPPQFTIENVSKMQKNILLCF